ncbi:MAG TPA: hypothetical protein VK191_08620 [Symbiobacteriaceae bacterium]|nr:hypothetical protein [Symbiobacteriaceae bacterium]
MDQKGLNQPVTTGGVRLPTFYNGRVLTAEDLQQLQAAEGALRQQVARAAGSGIARGLTCTAAQTMIQVDAGLGVGADGALLYLANPVEVAIAGITSKTATAVGFQDCGLKSAPLNLTGEAPYLLVAGPAQTAVDSSPQVWPTGSGKITSCGPGSLELGVQFRLLALPWSGSAAEFSNVSHLQSALALECFDGGRLPYGQSQLGAFAAAQLRADGLLAQNEVPLCLFYWRSGQILFLDQWAVRRRVEMPMLGPDGVGLLHVAEGEALSQQFQAQLATLTVSGGIAVEAKACFQALPAAGFVPTTFLPDFFNGMNAWQGSLHPAQVRIKLWDSFLTAPIDPLDPYGPPVNYVYLDDNLIFYWTEFSYYGNWVTATPAAEEPKTELPGALAVQLTADGGVETEKLLSGAKVTAIDADGKSYTARIKKVGRYESSLKALAVESEVASLRTFAESDNQTIKVETTTRTTKGKATSRKGSEQVRATTTGETPPIIATPEASVQFELTGLPPSSYLVQVSVKGFKGASKKATVQASQSGAVTFRLLAGVESDTVDGLKDLFGKKGRKGWKADFLPKGWWGKGWAVPSAVKYPPAISDKWERVVDPPAAVLLELAEIGEAVKAKYPKAAVDPGEVQIWLNPDHTPASSPKEPYAWAQFGTGGAAVPLILTGTDRTLDRSIGLTKVEIDGSLDEQALTALGIAEVDALAGVWTGLLTQVLEVPEGAASGLVKAARTAIDAIKGTAKEWATEKPAIADALAEQGLGDATKLANKRPEVLVEELKEKGVEIAAWEAEKIVKDARAAAPESTWSVESLKELSKSQTEALAAKGIATQEELKEAAKSDPAMVAQVTGLKVEEVANVVTAIEGARTEAAVVKAGALPVTQVVESETAVLALGKAGFGTLGALAKADVGAVTAALGGDATTAAKAVSLAKSRFSF